METKVKLKITVKTVVKAPVEKVWKYWTSDEDIVHWNNASEEWYTPRAENNLRKGGNFNYRMEALDGSMGFDFWGIYDKVLTMKQIEYTLGDDRKVRINFSTLGKETEVVETFEAEDQNSVELQRTGWQSILDNFKKYAEAEHNK
jgi:uncharacterized protein YndB with AHSA1/START domain